jgi:hypothetical protein
MRGDHDGKRDEAQQNVESQAARHSWPLPTPWRPFRTSILSTGLPTQDALFDDEFIEIASFTSPRLLALLCPRTAAT